MSTSLLPPFLQPLQDRQVLSSTFLNAQFTHPNGIGSSHALWWQPPNVTSQIDIMILFIPGNPGLADFYIPFLDSIFAHHSPKKNIAILAHSHLDHSPSVSNLSVGYLQGESLTVQVQAAINVLDAVHDYAKGAKVIIFGHSVGSWISLEVFKRAEERISALFLLTPTISCIGSTPNGQRLSRIFSPPFSSILGTLSPLTQYLPRSLFRVLFPSWPLEQVSVLRQFLSSSTSVLASLCMAYEEMKTIKEPDFKLLHRTSNKLYFYYAEKDDWVGDEKTRILDELDPTGTSSNFARGPPEIPHAFCINHSEIVSEQCNKWIYHVIDG